MSCNKAQPSIGHSIIATLSLNGDDISSAVDSQIKEYRQRHYRFHIAGGVTYVPDAQSEKSTCLIYTEEYVVSNHKEDTDNESGLAVEEKRPDLKPPKQYKVVLINDDYTPMEFVVQILMTFFGMDHAKATRVMMAVHTKGRGVCGIFSHEIAETKVEQVNEFSRLNQHPLLCTMEEV